MRRAETRAGADEKSTPFHEHCRVWSDRRLIETYRRLSHDLRRRGFDLGTVERMGRVEVELRKRDIDPDVIAREVAENHSSTVRK